MTSQSETSVLVSREGAVAVVTLNRVAVINAINMEIRRQLPTVMRELDADASITAIILAGAGSRGFCSGADIKEARPLESPAGERRRLTPVTWIEEIAATIKPVIAVLHGACVGAGLELALACDLRVAATGARLGLPETALGLIPGGGGTQRLSRLIGTGLALDMILTGRLLDAEGALSAGLVTRVLPSHEAAMSEARSIAEVLAARPPLALAYAKEAVLTGAGVPLADGLRLEKSLFAILASTDDRREAAEAFREKRKPRFSGQ